MMTRRVSAASIATEVFPPAHPLRGGALMLMVLLLPLVFLGGCRSRSSQSPGSAVRFDRAPVIIISIDTLRADRLPAYGYQGVATPALDQFRRDAILYQHAYSHVPLTLPSHVSMLTGQLPAEHGVRNNLGYLFDASRQPTIPALLKSRGYENGAAVSAYVLRGSTGLRRAFDFYDDSVDVRPGVAAGSLQRGGDLAADSALRWIEGRGANPFFFLLHLFEPHSPYDAGPAFQPASGSTYDGEIAKVDAIAGRFLQSLRDRGVYDRALIIITSDHGEGLSEHGEEEHGIFLYREAIHVPLLVKLPKQQAAGTTVRQPAQLIDLLPTITSITGAEVPTGLRGQNLLTIASSPARTIFSETVYPRVHLGWSELRSLVGERFHFIQAPRPELYDVASDPGERKNVLAENRRVYAAMNEQMAPLSAAMTAPASIDPEEAAKLAALGYLGSTAAPSDGPLPDPKDRIGEIALMREAARLSGARKYDAAIAAFKRIIAANPRLTDAWSNLAQTYERAGRIDEAIEAYKQVVNLSRGVAGETAMSIGALYLKSGRHAEARAHAELGLRGNPGSARILLGRIHLAQKQYAGAASEAREAAKDSAYRLPAAVLTAQSLVGLGRLPEALAIIEPAAREVASGKHAPVPLLEFVRGDLYARMNRLPQAEEALQNEIRLFPDDRQAYANLAVVYLLQGKVADAERTAERLVSANPDRAAYDLAATTFEELGAVQLASSWRRRAARRS